MSRDILGEELKSEQEARDSYEPGILHYKPSLVKDVADLYLSGELDAIRYSFNDPDTHLNRACVLYDVIDYARLEGFDHNRFIEDVLTYTRDTKEWQPKLHVLLNSLVQALYMMDYNSFDMDINPFIGSPDNLLCYLHGTDAPLEATLHLEDFHQESVAADLENCKIELFGRAGHVGWRSKSSVFVCHDEVWSVGGASEDCEFHIQSTHPIPVHTTTHFTSTDSRYYVEKGVSKNYLSVLKKTEFAEKGNTLFVPDENNPGEWKEVTP